MAVLLETSKGDIVIDLFVEECPMTCKNFLKLCKVKYYNNSLFHNVQRDFLAQTGDPTGTGKGGDSLYALLYGSQARFFDDEISPKRRHGSKGCVGMASAGPDLNASQFYITLGSELSSLDEKHTLFGQVSEGLDVLEAMNEVPVDAAGRPLQNIRIRHTIVLDDPFDDPPQLEDHIPDASPPPTFEHGDRLEEDWVPEADERDAEEIEKEAAAAEAKNRAVVLEMIGDLPEADVKPPSNMLFVCKLNPVTTEEDLEIIFSRFGNVTSCDIIRDHKTGDSLCYAFIGYDNDQSCEAAYFKMNNVLIDDRRIKVDFSQSVSHIWKQFKRHGKAGGNAGTAAEADAHERGQQQQQQQQRGPPSGSRYITLKGPGQRDRGMLFDHPEEPVQQQQQQCVQQQEQQGGRDGGRRRWDEPQSHRSSSRKRSRSRSRDRSKGRAVSRSRSRSRERSRSDSRDHKHKKHKKHYKEDRKREKHEREAAADGSRRGYSSRREEQRGHDGRDGGRGRDGDADRQAEAGRYHSRRGNEGSDKDEGRDRGGRDRREDERSGRGGERDRRESDRSRDGEHRSKSYDERSRGNYGQDRDRDRDRDRDGRRGREDRYGGSRGRDYDRR